MFESSLCVTGRFFLRKTRFYTKTFMVKINYRKWHFAYLHEVQNVTQKKEDECESNTGLTTWWRRSEIYNSLHYHENMITREGIYVHKQFINKHCFGNDKKCYVCTLMNTHSNKFVLQCSLNISSVLQTLLSSKSLTENRID